MRRWPGCRSKRRPGIGRRNFPRGRRRQSENPMSLPRAACNPGARRREIRCRRSPSGCSWANLGYGLSWKGGPPESTGPPTFRKNPARSRARYDRVSSSGCWTNRGKVKLRLLDRRQYGGPTAYRTEWFWLIGEISVLGGRCHSCTVGPDASILQPLANIAGGASPAGNAT